MYAVLRQFRKGGPGSGQFFVTLHPGCVSEYFHKSWERHQAKPHIAGRPTGTVSEALKQFDEVELALRGAKLQRRRRIVAQMRTEDRDFKLASLLGEIRVIDTFLTENGMARTWTKVWSDKDLANLGPKIERAEQWSKEHS